MDSKYNKTFNDIDNCNYEELLNNFILDKNESITHDNVFSINI